jgi:hypothetical protein
MDAFECGRPAAIRHHGMWLCADHYDSVCRGESLIQERRSQSYSRKFAGEVSPD